MLSAVAANFLFILIVVFVYILLLENCKAGIRSCLAVDKFVRFLLKSYSS